MIFPNRLTAPKVSAIVIDTVRDGGAVSGSFAIDLRPDGTAVVRARGELDF